MSQILVFMRKPAYCVCENQVADICAVTADQQFVFTSIALPLFFLNRKYQAYKMVTAWIVLDLVGNPDMFSHDSSYGL